MSGAADNTMRMAKVRRVEDRLATIFPPTRQSSPAMVALLVRYDELLFLLRQFEQAEREERARKEIGDPRPVLWHMIVARLLLVSAHDALAKLDIVMRDPAVKQAINDAGEPGTQFMVEVETLRAAGTTAARLRNKFGAHLDAEPIRRVLASPVGQELGTLWQADQGMDCQYDAAHSVVMAAWAFGRGAKDNAVDDERMAEFKSMVDAASTLQLKLPSIIRTLLLLFERTSAQEGQ